MLKILYSPRFAKRFRKLPWRVRAQAMEREVIFRADPFDARLKTHKLHGELVDCWAFSIDHSTRIIFSFEKDGVVYFHAVGGHDLYDGI